MDDHDWKAINRANRRAWWEYKKEQLGIGRPSYGPDVSGKEVLIGLSLFLAIPAAIICIALKCGNNTPDPGGYPAETHGGYTGSYPGQPRPQPPALPKPSATARTASPASEREMSRKYLEIVKKKQRLKKENDAILRRFTKDCLRLPLRGAKGRHCDRLDKRFRKNNEWIRRH